MSGQSGGQRLRLSALNDHLTCKLCGGYFVDATTIIECLHTFCKSCIVKYLESSKYCPVCDAQVHKNKPLLNLRPDHIIQDIVYKLVPGCYQNEMRCRKEFYAKHPEEKNKVASPEARGEPPETHIYSPDESLSLSLEYYSPEVSDETDNDKEAALKHLPRRYLRCPAAVTVSHLQKLIRAKYGLSEAHRVDIMYKDEPLCAIYTLMDIMYIYHWRRKVPLHLSYRIFESAPKRIKFSDDNDEFKQSLSNSNIEIDVKEDDQSIKREWKEVQLKISETGVMSVTDISSLDTKKSTKVSEINQQGSLDQANSHTGIVNKAVIKTEEKEPVKCTAKSRKAQQQDNLTQKNDKSQDEKTNLASASAIATSQSNSKCSEMKVKSIDQKDLSNDLRKASSDVGNPVKTAKESVQISQSSSADKNQTQPQSSSQQQQLQDKSKAESVSSSPADKRTDGKQQNVTNNNLIGSAELKTETNSKQNSRSGASSAGSKINALSAKLQFQPKVGQVNNTYSKKSNTSAERKRSSSPSTKVSEPKSLKTSPKSESKPSTIDTPSGTQADAKKLTSSSNANVSVTYSKSGLVNASSVYVTAPSGTVNSTASIQQQNKNNSHTPVPPSSESLASMGLHVSTTMSQASLNSWMAERASSQKNSPNKSLTVDQQLRSLPGMPHIGKDIVCSTTASSGPVTSMGRISIQTPSMSIYYSSPSKVPTSKANYDVTNLYPVPPCPDAIPISLMKPPTSSTSTTVNARKDAVSKGTMLNEICDKIRSGTKHTGSGSGESSKDKSKLEAQQRGKPELPELLKISKKNESPGSSSPQVKHIPNIPNVPMYTPSNSQQQQQQQQQQMHIGAEAKDSAKRPVAAIAPSSQASLITATHQQQHQHALQQKQLAEQSKQSPPVGAYKTLRFPPKSWNPTLSKNNYVAVKNQAKEMQAAYSAAADGSSASKQIPSKPPKIFKNKNMPRFLGNPASGVKPMYGVGNEQIKEKEQPSSTKNIQTMNMTKIDPQTLSPIVSSHNSTMASPPPYSPTARSSSYQNSPYSRDICQRNNTGNSTINSSPRNSPVNMLSTNPFIPSHTPNTNPRILYFPPTGYGSDAGHLSNPLIRPPLPPPSAFHCSLPPSINKLYQRSGYIAQLQTNVAAAAAAAAGFSAAAGAGHATAQRMQQPLSSHTSPLPTTSSPSSSSSSKSPKNSLTSPPASSAAAANISLARSEALSITSAASIVDSVALQLAAKGLAQQRDNLNNVFNLARAESLKSSTSLSSPISADAKQTGSSSPTGNHNLSKSSNSPPQKSSPNTPTTKLSDTSVKVSEPKMEVTSAALTPSNKMLKEADKKDKSPAKINGGIAVTMPSSDKPRDAAVESQLQQQQQQQQNKIDKSSESKNTTDGLSEKSSSPPKSTGGKNSSVAPESDKSESKQINNTSVQSKQESDTVSASKVGCLPLGQTNKAGNEVKKEKVAES